MVWAQALGFVCVAGCVEVNAQRPPERHCQQTEPAPARRGSQSVELLVALSVVLRFRPWHCPWCRNAIVLVTGLSVSTWRCPWYPLSVVLSTRAGAGAVRGAENTSLTELSTGLLVPGALCGTLCCPWSCL